MIPLKSNKGDFKENTDKQRLHNPIFKVTFTANVKTQVTDSVFSDGPSLLMSGINS